MVLDRGDRPAGADGVAPPAAWTSRRSRHDTPGEDHQGAVRPETGLLPFQARRLAYELGFTGDQVAKAEKIMLALSKVFLEKDASIAEVNPLAVTKKGDVVVLDAKIDFDDNAAVPPQGRRRPSAT